MVNPNQHLFEFQQLLEKILSPDNEVRKVAEEALEKIDINQRTTLLFLTSKSHECNVENRQMSLVLLRRLLSNDWDEIWKNWTPDVQVAFKNEILLVCQSEQNETIRKRLCDLIAEVARNHLDDTGVQTWPEVLKFLFDCTKSDSVHLKENALMIFENSPGIFGNQQDHYLAVIKEMLQASLQYNGAMTVKLAAVKAATAFLCDNEGNQHLLKIIQSIVPDILRVAIEATETEEDDVPLECLTDLAGAVPKLLRPQLADLCTFCLKTVSDINKEECYRHSALEVLVSLADSAPAMVRKDAARFIPEMIKQCLALMVEVDDDDKWDESDEPEEEDTESGAAIGETSLDRLACSLGGKCVLQPTLQLVRPMLQHENWKHRYAALLALSTIGEGCHKQMENVLESIVDGILPYLQDPHPRVRYASCNALGQMSSDFAPTLQKKFHQKIIPALLAVLENLNSPRVAAHAGAALVNFSEDAPKHVVVSYLDPMMRKFEWVLEQTLKLMMEKQKKLVLEQIITTIASVADTAEEAFAPYYSGVMPCLKFILQNANTPNLKLMRGKTIECVSLIGLAVGKEKFYPDANEVMQLLLKAHTEIGEQIEADDPQLSYMISAWTRICRIMGKDFQQYLPLVMPSVMKTASFKPEVTVIESEDAKQLEGDDDWEFVNLGDQQSFGIKTSGLEDKATACQMLVCYARELKGAFAEYVEEVTKLMVPLLKFYFHDGVRSAASESLPYLLESAKEKGPQFVADMWKFIFPELLKAIELDPESEVLSEHLWSLAKCVEFLGAGCVNEEEMQEIIKVLEKLLVKHFEKATEREEARKDEDYDEEVEKELEGEHEEDAVLLSKISDVFHSLFFTYKETILPFFDMLLQYFVKLLEPNRTTAERQWAICLFDDVIEFGGAGSVKYQQYFLAPMVTALQDSAPEVRQAAAYGFGVMGMFGGNIYAQACTEAIPHLGKMIESPEARSSDMNTTATENAISAVAKILKYNNSMVDANQVLPAFIGWLPISEDDDECGHVYGYFCDLIEAGNPIVVGENHSNVPHLLKIIAEAFNRNAFTKKDEEDAADLTAVARRMCHIVRQIQTNPAIFEACLGNLDEHQRQALNVALTTF